MHGLDKCVIFITVREDVLGYNITKEEKSMEGCTYSDAFSIMASLTDVKIDFSISNPKVDAGGNIVGDEHIFEHRIVLSLPLAKDLAQKLKAAVDNYENTFGHVVDLGEIQTKIKQESENG